MKELSRIPTRVFIAFFGQDYFLYSDPNLYRPFTMRILRHHKEGNGENWRGLERTGEDWRGLERTGERTVGNCRGLETTT